MSADHPFLQGTNLNVNGAPPPSLSPGLNASRQDQTQTQPQQPHDDLALRTSNLSISDPQQSTSPTFGQGTFPVQKSVWPIHTHSLTNSSPEPSPARPNRNTFAAFDVADRRFDKDPSLLKAEHDRISPGVYYHESPQLPEQNGGAHPQVHPQGQGQVQGHGQNGYAGLAAAGAGVLAAGQGLLHHSPAPRPHTHHEGAQQAQALPVGVPSDQGFGRSVPDQDQGRGVPDVQGSHAAEQAQVQPQQQHHGLAAGAAGAGTGLAAAAGAHSLVAQPQEQQLQQQPLQQQQNQQQPHQQQQPLQQQQLQQPHQHPEQQALGAGAVGAGTGLAAATGAHSLAAQPHQQQLQQQPNQQQPLQQQHQQQLQQQLQQLQQLQQQLQQLQQLQQQQPEHRGIAAGAAGAGAGLAAAAGAHAFASEPRAPQQGDYFGDARAPSPLTAPASSEYASRHDPLPAPQAASASNGSFKRLGGSHVDGYTMNGHAANGHPNGHPTQPKHERTVSDTTKANTAANAGYLNRPMLNNEPSRSYINPASPRTSYDQSFDGMQRRSSARSATKFVEHLGGATSPQRGHASRLTVPVPLAGNDEHGGEHVHSPREDPYAQPRARPSSAQDFERRSSAQAEPNGPFGRAARPVSAMADTRHRDRALSPNASLRGQRLPPISDEVGYTGVGAGGLALGEVASLGRQHDMQYGHLRDDGPVPYPPGHRSPGARSPEGGRYSSFGHRPEPGIGDWAARREEGRLARSGTALSRTTVGRSGTQRSRRSGAFGRGSAFNVGTQPEDVLGRDDIHQRTEVSERVLSPAALRKLQGMEKKDGRALAKLLKQEGKEQARAVAAAIADLKKMARMQKGAIESERKSQRGLAKWTGREHRARMRFLKEKERYEKVEGELRNAENDYEERRDHAAGLTAQIAEKTQELDDLRAQKAADDREREVKLLAIKNPGHV